MTPVWLKGFKARAIARVGGIPWWREPAPALREVRCHLDLPVQPSPMLHRAVQVFFCCQAVHALELAALGHVLAATAAAAILAATIGWWCRLRQGTTGRPRRLLVSAAGRIHLLTSRGEVVSTTLSRASARYGPWIVLDLIEGRRHHRLLFGPDNLSPAQLAALRRRVFSLANPTAGGP